MLEMEIPYELWLLLKNYSFRGELNCRIFELCGIFVIREIVISNSNVTWDR